ncbi:MAG: hypothetical protein ACKOBW_00815, partial [Planctomycetota bacterium]
MFKRERRVIVWLDAFDQMPSDDREHVLVTLSRAANSVDAADHHAASCAWFITGRQYALKPFESRLPKGTRHLRLERFSPAEQDAYVDDVASHPFFQKLQVKPLDWICCPRANLAEDLSLPFNLRMIRRRLERLLEDVAASADESADTSANSSNAWSKRQFGTTGELHAAVARDLLEQAVKREEEAILRGRPRPAGQPSQEADRIECLFRVTGLLAIQMMLENRWNASVDAYANTNEDRWLGINGVQAFLQRVKDRFIDGCQRAVTQRSVGASQAASDSSMSFETRWNWAIELLRREEVTHRGDIYTFNRENRSFRDRKTMEWYAAHYRMNYVTEAQLSEVRKVQDLERGP